MQDKEDVPEVDLASILLPAMREGVALFDPQFRLVAWNDTFARMEITPRRSLRVGTSIDTIYRWAAERGVFGRGEPAAIARERLDGIRTGAAPAVEDLRGPGDRSLEVRRFFLPGVGVLALFSDVTELRRCQKLLCRAESLQTLGRMAGGLVHDFNNLLTVITGNLERAQSSIALARNERRAVEAALGAATRGAGLTRTALGLTDDGGGVAERVSIRDAIREAVRFIRRVLPENVRVTEELPDQALAVNVVRGRLVVAILNVALNARDAMPSGGPLAVRVEAVPDGSPYGSVVVSLADEGTGMAPEVLARVTEPFFSTKSPDSGTGLGLAEVQRFAEAAGGGLDIDSELGVGTTVRISLPAYPIASPISDARRPRSLPDVLCLVVEDEPDVQRVLLDMLEGLGLRARAVGSAEAALLALPQDDYGLVLTDLILSGEGDGIDLARAVAAEHPGVPVVVCTGYDRAVQVDGVALPVIHKPFSSQALAQFLRDVLT